MQFIATGVTRSMVCVLVLGIRVSCAKTNEAIVMPFGKLALVGQGTVCLIRCQDRTNPFATARDTESSFFCGMPT